MKPGRPLEYDLENVLDIATDLFMRKGYQDTSLRDLLIAMNISKSSFYYAFGSKYELFEQCIYRFNYQQVTTAIKELQQASNGRNFIENFMYRIEATISSRKMLHTDFLINTALESSEHHPKISILISKTTCRYVEVFKKAIERGQSENVISKNKNPDDLAFYILNCISGLRVMIKANIDQRNIKNIIGMTLAALD